MHIIIPTSPITLSPSSSLSSSFILSPKSPENENLQSPIQFSKIIHKTIFSIEDIKSIIINCIISIDGKNKYNMENVYLFMDLDDTIFCTNGNHLIEETIPVTLKILHNIGIQIFIITARDYMKKDITELQLINNKLDFIINKNKKKEVNNDNDNNHVKNIHIIDKNMLHFNNHIIYASKNKKGEALLYFLNEYANNTSTTDCYIVFVDNDIEEIKNVNKVFKTYKNCKKILLLQRI